MRSAYETVREGALALADAALTVNRPAVAVPFLERLVAADLNDEVAHARLLTALAASGRQAEALARYQQLRARLGEELGVSPSPVVQEAHLAVLRSDRSAGRGAFGHAPRPPCLLPADLGDFIGRIPELLTLRATLGGDRVTGAPRVAVVTGPVGIGKTSLAIHIGHQLRDRYPDGQLYADLHGLRTEASDPADVLARFLVALGVAPAAVPAGLDARAELYRATISDRRVLVVLDNAAAEAQVRPLVPGRSSSAVLVTARRQLAGLGGVSVSAGRLAAADARGLLVRIIGPDRVTAEPEAAEEVVARCAGVPLAVRIVGARLAGRTHQRLADLAARLRPESLRLGEFRFADLDLRAGLALSEGLLSPGARRCLRQWSMLGDVDRSAPELASLLGDDVTAVETHVDELVDLHLAAAAPFGPSGTVRFQLDEFARLYCRTPDTTGKAL
jgi:hypothetical protein